MGGQFPELKAQKNLIISVISEEENSFLKTLATGINLLEGVIAKSKAAGANTISGEDAFLLYDTYGFPIDLTELIASEQGFKVDLENFEIQLQAQKARSRNAAAVETEDWVELLPIKESVFTGYDTLSDTVKIARYRKVSSKNKSYFQVVFDKTPFYANSGGQAGDTGYIASLDEKISVNDTQKENGLSIHILSELPEKLDAEFSAVVNAAARAASERNHSATHLMHEALREVLGEHVEQKGSMVNAEYLRFDFSHFQKVTPEQIREVERKVNAKIRENILLEENRECAIEDARELGAMMLFGEKYGDKVRVIKYGSSVELCGGTHVKATGSIGLFKILSESATSAGVRRIEALTGEKAEQMLYHYEDTFSAIQGFVNSPKVLPAIEKMIADNAEFHKQLEEVMSEKINAMVETIKGELVEENGVVLCVKEVNFTADAIKTIAFTLKAKFDKLVFVVGSNLGDKTTLSIMLGDEIVKKGVNASQIIRTAAKEINGGGGGQAFFATAGGKKAEGLEKAILTAKESILEIVNQ